MNRKYIYIILTFALCIASSCKDYLDINTDPNNPIEVQPNRLLPAAQVHLAFATANDLQRITSAFMQYYAGVGNQLVRYDTYSMQPADSDAAWEAIYAGVLKDLRQMDALATQTQDNRYLGISRIMSAYTFSIATDVWGDVPFKEALQDIDNLAPTFTPQSEVYDGLFTMIDEGIAFLNQADLGSDPGQNDLIYGGDVDLWKRAANTLKLKLHLQIRKRNADRSASAINALIAEDNFIADNAQNFEVPFFTEIDRQHPMYDFAYNSRAGDIAISQRFIDSMAVNQDPRIPFYFNNNNQKSTTNPDSLIYRGFDNGGQGTAPAEIVRARLGVYPVGQNGGAPQRLLTYFQTQFMLAEAALTLGTSGDVRTYLENAITASLQEVGVAASSVENYVNQRLAAYDAAPTNEAKLNVIMREKWVAQFGMGIESWNDWRRTGYPQLDPATVNLSPNEQIPVRLFYSINELVSNKNAPGQIQITQPVWWDVD